MQDDRFEVQNDPTCTNIGFSIRALSGVLEKTEYGEKGQRNFYAVTLPSPISRDTWQAAAQSNHQCQWEDWFHAIEQEKKGV